jgi:thiol-disulfide isomerase/thioredoxin
MTIRDVQPGMVRAQELYGDYWFNAEPVTVAAQRGSVMLLDFWDYSCAGSIRALPYVKDWHKKYGRQGLVVIGVHTPRFAFGRDPVGVQRAIERFRIPYPVVMDNEGMIWSRYENRFWPAQHLVDRHGFVRLVNVGEGGYAATEHLIQTLMLDAGLLDEIPLLSEPLREADRSGAVSYRATPELFAGYLRGSIGNVEGYSPESEMHYADPGIYVEGRFYVAGDWSNDRDALTLLGDCGGHVLLRYAAIEVNAVFSPGKNQRVQVEVRQDGGYLNRESLGEDVRIDSSGRSSFVVDEPRCYSIVRNREHSEHVLHLTASAGGTALYSLSFVSGVVPELISG